MIEIMGLYCCLIFCAYIVGSIPTGFLISRLCGVGDIRSHGSGTIGASNVARSLGVPFFFLILLIDAGKACVFLCLLHAIHVEHALLLFSAGSLLVGNCCSVFLCGGGGKGVATLFGIVCALSVPLALLFALTWALLFLITRVPTCASLTAAVVLSLTSLCTGDHGLFFTIAVTVLFVQHRKNVSELIFSGTVA